MSYSTFFRLGLSLASEPKDTSNDGNYASSYPSPLSPSPPTGTAPPPPLPQITLQTPTPTRPITRRRRSSLTILTSPMSGVKSTIRAASEAVRVALRSPIRSEFEVAKGANENVPPAANNNTGLVKRGRRKTVNSQNPLLAVHRAPPRFPPPTSPLPPTPLSPSFSKWSQKDTPDPVLPQTPTKARAIIVIRAVPISRKHQTRSVSVDHNNNDNDNNDNDEEMKDA